MYAFRKPFNAGTYQDLLLWGMQYKDILIISQVLGYMSSKFIGIKVISELNKTKRALMIIAFILFAESMLLLFGLVPYPYNFILLFFNGLPLGMVWGIVFSFLEGRKFTELLGVGLSTSAIISSGMLKSIGVFVIRDWGVSDFWMPVIVGAMFIPLLFFCVWMLTVIPEPSEEDKALRSERLPMSGADRKKIITTYGIGLFCLVITYMALTVCRDFRDNFMVEIWKELGIENDVSIYTKTEFIIAMVVTCTTALVVLVRSNLLSLRITYLIFFTGVALSGSSTILFVQQKIAAFTWMTSVGLGMYMAYVPFQIVIYERLVAAFKMKGNAGFLMYISDSLGYLASVGVLFLKNFFLPKASLFYLFTYISYALLLLGIPMLVFSIIYFLKKYQKQYAYSAV
ncbi:DUF5690 family protein [Rapidithrix thailandica]|uniref:DUF5690 family protein n=1 Tax=Rapidithrix thailandica TaxID=413964 RepID=A0AAW9RUX7_9BACT